MNIASVIILVIVGICLSLAVWRIVSCRFRKNADPRCDGCALDGLCGHKK